MPNACPPRHRLSAWSFVPARSRLWLIGACALATGAAGCDREAPAPEVPAPTWVTEEERAAGPPTARWDMVGDLRADLAAQRHPSDGGGRAWLEAGEQGGGDRAVVGQPGTFTLVYEAGPLGIAEGGALALQVSPFWGWSTPQVLDPDAPGYTVVERADPGAAPGLAFEPATWGEGLLGITIAGRALGPGERVRIRYGAGPAGALPDRFAEDEPNLWIAVDGDGDGVRGLIEQPPSVRVEAGFPAGLVLSLPGTLRPGEEGVLHIATVDRVGNACTDLTGELRLEVWPEGLALPATAHLGAADAARLALPFRAEREGLFRVRALGPGGLLGQSNPLLISAQVPRVRFGDLHGHSGLSDGTGSPEAYWAYARDVAGLDFAALTDHDHWGMRFLDQHPEVWERILAAGRREERPGRFLALPGYEWTSWIHGHRHVVFFGAEARVWSSMDPRTEHPRGLWEALRGQKALTFAHHPGGGPIPIDWSIAPDSELEPVVEVTSVHGVSEAMDAPGVIYSAVPGHFGRDALDLGYLLGFVGGGDSHDGHPGLTFLASNQGGLTAVLDAELDRDSLWGALRARRTYATNGCRTLLFTTLDGHPMGSTVTPSAQGRLVLFTIGDAPLQQVDIVRTGAIMERIAAVDQPMVQATVEIEALESGEYLYVRVLQQNGGVAISSPFFVRAKPATRPAPPERND